MPAAERARALEKCLRYYGEELGRVRRTVSIQHRRRSGFPDALQRRKLSAHHSRPCQVLPSRGESWRAVCLKLFVVELMRELVQDQVPPIRGMRRAAFRIVPSQHQRSKPARGLTEPWFATFVPDISLELPRFIRCVTPRDKQKSRLTRDSSRSRDAG